MKKVVLATFLACSVLASGLPLASAQDASNPAGAPAAGGAVQMSTAEAAVYNNANTQADPKNKAAALEQYLVQFPQSTIKENVLESVMVLYFSSNDATKALDAADRLLQVNPNNIKGLYVEATVRGGAAGSLTDATAKQAGLDAAASYAQKGLVATKSASVDDATFKGQQTSFFPTFYSAIAAAALNKKDTATAIDNYKKELAFVPVAQTQTPGPQLLDTFYLAEAYVQSTPPDYLNCAFYASRVIAFAPDSFKQQASVASLPKYCYHQYHGADDGFDAVAAVAAANLNPPAGFAASVKPAPTPAEQIHTIIATTTDLGALAVSDKEMVFQYGSPEDAAKVWDTIKGKSVELQGVVIASTPTQLQLAISDGAVQGKTADFTVNLAPIDPVPDLKPGATPAQKAANKKLVDAAAKEATEVAAASAVGQTVTVDGTYDSFTPQPIMITMSAGSVVLPKAPTKPAPKAPVHHTAAKK